MPSMAPIALQATGGLGAIALAVFCPQPGSPSVLVPIATTQPVQTAEAAEAAAAHWATREQARLVAFDPSTRRISVIAPTTASLVRALAYGFVPVAGDPSACTSPAQSLPPIPQQQHS